MATAQRSSRSAASTLHAVPTHIVILTLANVCLHRLKKGGGEMEGNKREQTEGSASARHQVGKGDVCRGRMAPSCSAHCRLRTVMPWGLPRQCCMVLTSLGCALHLPCWPPQAALPGC